jgi:hypothetical protein
MWNREVVGRIICVAKDILAVAVVCNPDNAATSPAPFPACVWKPFVALDWL